MTSSFPTFKNHGFLTQIVTCFSNAVAGLMNKDFEMLRKSSATITHYNSTGTAMSMAANRISFTFNLTGPSFAIDSACSSSLVALHLACQAIKQGICQVSSVPRNFGTVRVCAKI